MVHENRADHLPGYTKDTTDFIFMKSILLLHDFQFLDMAQS